MTVLNALIGCALVTPVDCCQWLGRVAVFLGVRHTVSRVGDQSKICNVSGQISCTYTEKHRFHRPRVCQIGLLSVTQHVSVNHSVNKVYVYLGGHCVLRSTATGVSCTLTPFEQPFRFNISLSSSGTQAHVFCLHVKYCRVCSATCSLHKQNLAVNSAICLLLSFHR